MRIFGGEEVLADWARGPLALALGVESPVGLPGLVPSSLSLPSLLPEIQAHKPGLMDSWYRGRDLFCSCFFFLMLAKHCQNLRPGAHQNHGHYVFPPCLSLQHSIYNFAEANEACALCLPLARAWPCHPCVQYLRSPGHVGAIQMACALIPIVCSVLHIHGVPPM